MRIGDHDHRAGGSDGVPSAGSAVADGEPLEGGVEQLVGGFDPVPGVDLSLVGEDEGARLSLEVRWIFRGGLPAGMLEWLGPFAEAPEEREDCYLLEPHILGVSLKIRDATLLDVKVAQGSRGVLGLRHAGRGHLQAWEKLSFPLDATAPMLIGGSRWVSVEKLRRRRSFTSVAGQTTERPLSEIENPGCAVELTEVHVGGDVAWTLAFEAHGAPTALDSHLRTTASHLIRDAPPGGVRLGLRESMSYVRWLRSPEIGRRAASSIVRRDASSDEQTAPMSAKSRPRSAR